MRCGPIRMCFGQMRRFLHRLSSKKDEDCSRHVEEDRGAENNVPPNYANKPEPVSPKLKVPSAPVKEPETPAVNGVPNGDEPAWTNESTDMIQMATGTDRDCLQFSPLTDFVWFMEGSSWITEGRTFYIVTETGEYVFFQVVYASSGWRSTVQCTVRYFDSRQASTVDNDSDIKWTTIPEEGPSHHFECSNFSASKFKTSKSKTSARVSSDLAIELVGFGPEHDVESPSGDGNGNGKKGFRIYYKSRAITLDLFFAVFSDKFISFGDGNIHFGQNRADGSINIRFLPFGNVTGSMNLQGKEMNINARGFCIHLYQGMRPNLVATRWKLSAFLPSSTCPGLENEDLPWLFMIQMNTPPTYGNAVVNLSYLVADEKILGVSRSSSIQQLAPAFDRSSGYYVPTDYQIDWKGYTLDGNTFEADCTLAPKVMIARINVLNQLPYVMRKVIETFVTRPYVYQWLNKTEVRVKVGDDSFSCDGFLFQELSILNEDQPT